MLTLECVPSFSLSISARAVRKTGSTVITVRDYRMVSILGLLGLEP